MSQMPIDSPEPIKSYTTLTVETVQQWRSDVDAFFSSDWQQLKDLILEMEETLWDESTPKKKNTEVATPTSHSLVEHVLADDLDEFEELARDKSSVIPDSSDIDVEPVPELEARQKLNELARQIEERLKSST